MGYKKIEYKNKSELYEFECYNLNDIKDDFDDEKEKKIYRIGKFLSLLYKKRIRVRGYEEGDYLMVKGFVYVSNKELEGILGIEYWKDVINVLSRRNIINYRRDKSNKFDSNKKLWFFKLNDDFFNCNKKRIKIEDGILNRFIDNKNEKLKNEYISNIDDLVYYEKYCCINSDLIIENLNEVIDLRVKNKLNEIQDKLIWDWLSNKKKTSLLKKIENIEDWKFKYKRELKNYYEVVIDDLRNLKENNLVDLDDNCFRRDNYGKRLYNLYSRVIREFREYIKIDGEEVVEIDIKSCFMSLLFMFIKKLNSNNQDDLIIDIKKKLLELNNGNIDNRNGLEFLNKFNSIFENDGIFYNNKVEFNDYYDLIRLSYGEDVYNKMSRGSFKDLVFKVLFSDNIGKRGIKIGDENIEDIENRLFGVDGKNLINDLRKIGLNNWIENKGGRKKKYNRGNNVSLLLMLYENKVMDIIREKLMNLEIKYISVFDSFIVKKSEYRRVLMEGNKILKGIDSSLKFSVKSDVNLNNIFQVKR